MKGKNPYPWEGWSAGAIVLRFLMALLFGLFVDVVVAAAVWYWFWDDTASFTCILVVLAALPVVWGVLGIFFFEKMIDIATEVVESRFRG